ncbi:MAG: AAA family ATPase [Candidatus Helarchaeota archaeon]
MLSVKVNNIGGLQEQNIFEFSGGLNIIKAPNASGKSSLINAFKLALNGSNFSSLKSLNEYLSDFKDGGSITIEIDGDRIELNLERSKDGKVKVVNYSSSVDFLDERLTRLIFFDQFSDIYQTIITGNTERFKDWISNITDIKLYVIAKDIADNKSNELQSQFYRLMDQDKGAKVALENELKDLKKDLSQFESEQEAILQSSNNFELRTAWERVIPEFDRVENQLAEAKLDKEKKERAIFALDKNIKNMQEDVKKKEKDFETIKLELMKIEGVLEKLHNQRADIIEQNETLHADLFGRVKEVGGKKRKMEGLEEKLKSREKRRINQRSLFNYIECPTCYQPIDKTKLKVDIQKIEKEIKTLIKTIDEKRALLKQNKIELKKIDEKIEKATVELPKKKDDLDLKIQELIKKISADNKKLTKLSAEIPKLNQKIDKLEEDLSKIKQEKDDLIIKLAEENKKSTEINQKITDKKKEINAIEARLRQLSQDTELTQKLRKQVQAATEIKDYFQHIIEEIRNDIIGVINDEILNSFTLLELAELNYLSIEVGTYELEIRRKLGRKTKLIELSAAERTLVALIILYITKRVLLPNVPIFFIDETSNAFDDTRFHRIIEYLAKDIEILIVTKNEPFQGKRGNIITQNNIVHHF